MSEKSLGQPTASRQSRFSDVSALGRMIGWDIDFRQLDPGPEEIPAQIRVGRNVALVRVGFKRSYHQRGSAPSGTLTFGTPLNGSLDWYARPIDSPAIMNFNHASGFDCVSQCGFEAVVFSIREDYLQQVSETLRLPVPDHLSEPQAGSVVRGDNSVRSLRMLLRQLLDAEQPCLDEEQESAVTLELLNATLTDAGFNEKISLPARSRAIATALDYIEDNRYGSVTVNEISMNTGISLRTLDRAFQERFGIGPKAYLIRRRLMGVREILSDYSATTRVADAANEWGFWHMGQFAHDYRMLFGELPSDTLRRTPSFK